MNPKPSFVFGDNIFGTENMDTWFDKIFLVMEVF